MENSLVPVSYAWEKESPESSVEEEATSARRLRGGALVGSWLASG